MAASPTDDAPSATAARSRDGRGWLWLLAALAVATAVHAPSLELLASYLEERWSEFVENTGLTARWNVVFPDMRGNGESITRRKQAVS